jgi:ABC-type transport system substrate-binding protein/methyl-accepting chemotaxis protein
MPAASTKAPSGGRAWLSAALAPAVVLLGFAVLSLTSVPSSLRTLSVGVLTAAAVAVIGRLSAGRVLRAREATRDALHRAAAGDLTLTRAALSRSGEDALAEALHGLMVAMERILASFARLSEAVSGVGRDLTTRGRDLSQAAGVQNARAGETAAAMRGTDAAIGSLRESMETLAGAAENAGASLHEMTASVTQVSRSTSALRSFVDETAASFGGVVSALQEVSSAVENLSGLGGETARATAAIRASTAETDHQAQTAARLSERVSAAVVSGKTAVSGTLAGMHEIRGAVSGAADAATALAEHSARIGEILHAIEEIAGETNLLALNASIIAAQAGESGKTFSVLSDDIRDLSDRTAVSTEEVRGLVSAVRGGVEDVRRLLSDARRRTEEGVDLAQTSDATLDEIETLALESRRASEGIAGMAVTQSAEAARVSEATGRVSSEITRISEATRGQLETAKAVNARADRVRDLTEQLARAMEEQAAGGQTLLGSMERVTSTVDAIAEATVTLADGSSAVVRSMEEIQKAAERNAYAATSMNQAAQALEQESLLLRSRSSLFRLPSPVPGGRVRAALRYLDEDNFDPAFCQTIPQAILARTWGEGLVRFGEGTRILPELAESWDIDPSGTLYTFHLRRGVRWHEGGTLSAADVKASFERFFSPAVGAPLAYLFDAVEGFDDFRAGRAPGVTGLEAVGSAVLQVRLSRAVPFFLQLFTLPDITVLPASLLADPARARRLPSGTGAFVPREITFGKTARFDRYDTYWDRGRIALDGVDLDLTEDSEGGVFQRFLDGQLDVIWDIPYPEAARLMADPEWRPYIDSSVQLHTSFLVLRCDRAPLDDVRVRRALNHAVDRAALNERTFAGLTVPAASILPPHLVGHDPGLRPYRHDPERARALLAEAGRGDGLTLSTWLSPKDARDPLNPLPAVAAQLEAVGVKLVLEVLPGEEMSARKRIGVFPDVRLSRWFADFPDPDTFFSSLFYSKTEEVLDGGFRNAEVDRLVEKGARLLDAAEREAVYRDLNRLVQSEAPVIFLFHNRGFVLQAPRLRGAQAHLLPPPVRWNDLWLEP